MCWNVSLHSGLIFNLNPILIEMNRKSQSLGPSFSALCLFSSNLMSRQTSGRFDFGFIWKFSIADHYGKHLTLTVFLQKKEGPSVRCFKDGISSNNQVFRFRFLLMRCTGTLSFGFCLSLEVCILCVISPQAHHLKMIG